MLYTCPLWICFWPVHSLVPRTTHVQTLHYGDPRPRYSEPHLYNVLQTPLSLTPESPVKAGQGQYTVLLYIQTSTVASQ